MTEYKPIPPEASADNSSSRELTFTPASPEEHPGDVRRGSSPPAAMDFEPVKLRPRHDGWTIERQIAFLRKLADCGSVSAACRHVGMSRASARKLRLHAAARDFRDAWDAALDCAYAALEETAMERARNGVARPVFFRGEQVGEWRYHDERLTMFLLRFRRRHRFGPEADLLPRAPVGIPGVDPGVQPPFDPEGEPGGCMDVLDYEPEPVTEDGLRCAEGGEGME